MSKFKWYRLVRAHHRRRVPILKEIISEKKTMRFSCEELIFKRHIRKTLNEGKENSQAVCGEGRIVKVSSKEHKKGYPMFKSPHNKPNIVIGANQFLQGTPCSHQQHYRNYHSTVCYFDKKTSFKTNSDNNVHDYIIVGAGSAGCVLANRLSSDEKNTVHIIEAGPVDNALIIKMPDKFTTMVSAAEFNWHFSTIAQRNLNNRQIYYPQGKVLGGGSTINAMLYMRGHPLDYDRWVKEGATGWSYTDCLPYFKKSQRHESGEDLYRGGNGLMTVSRSRMEHVLPRTWVKAGIQAGYSPTEDFNGYKQEGFGEYDYTIHKGERCSTSKAFLEPALKRKNLTVTTNALATKVLFDGKRAVGIEMLNERGQLENIMAAKEVILSGGAINSPKLLMLSGVGDGDELKQHSIDVIQHIPGVGKNFQDHPIIPVQHKCKKPISLFSQQSFFKKNLNELQWRLFKTGWCTTSHVDSGCLIRSEPGVLHPDIQIHFSLFLLNDHGRQTDPFDAFQGIVYPLRSQSKGTISLKSNDPKRQPIIDPNFCSLERDLFELRQGIRYAREVFAQSAFDEFRGIEFTPGPEVQTDSELNGFIKGGCQHLYHATGTCKMGSTSNNEVVVDSQCRVVGLDNLRVVDASVMPSIVSANTNAATIMIAEKGADIILGNPPLPKMENVPVWTPKFPQNQRE